MQIKEEIKDYCWSHGITSIGFIKCREFSELRQYLNERKRMNLENEFEEHDLSIRIDGTSWFEGGKTIISIAFPYLLCEGEENVENGFSVYTKGLDYHYVLNKYLNEIGKIIEAHGGNFQCFVDSNSLPERYLAYISGVGFIGKNNLIITKNHGSYVFLGEIITDLEFYEEDKRNINEISLFKECGTCEVCYFECPTKSINKNIKNSNICLSYITQKKELESWEIKKMNGRIFGCDTCQIKCPYNQNIKKSMINEFRQLEKMNECNEEFIVNMGNSDFKEIFKKASCGWRGKNILKRNALIRKTLYLKDTHFVNKVKFSSPYLDQYRNELIKFTKLEQKNNL